MPRILKDPAGCRISGFRRMPSEPWSGTSGVRTATSRTIAAAASSSARPGRWTMRTPFVFPLVLRVSLIRVPARQDTRLDVLPSVAGMRAGFLRRRASAPPIEAGSAPAAARALVVHAAAAFLGAFLLFEVQLVGAKAILPRFGGSPAVWTTCMLFYQALLLAGYLYAHALTRRLVPRVQAGVHVVFLALALGSLPLAWEGEPAGETEPVLAILALLARSVALPAFLLSASSPLLQHW